MARVEDRLLVSTVQLDPPRGWVLVLDLAGQELDRVEVTQGGCFHPGGFSMLGRRALVPVAEYRPWSTTVVCAVDVDDLSVTARFAHDDHLGAALELPDGDVVAGTWGSRDLVRFDGDGRVRSSVPNPSHVVDLQDLQLAGPDLVIGTGVTDVATPAGLLQLGGIALLDLAAHRFVNEVPFPGYSPTGRVGTYNPTWFELDGSTLTMLAIPDDGDRAHLLRWQTTLAGDQPGRSRNTRMLRSVRST